MSCDRRPSFCESMPHGLAPSRGWAKQVKRNENFARGIETGTSGGYDWALGKAGNRIVKVLLRDFGGVGRVMAAAERVATRAGRWRAYP
jgi:hypothetical protein